MVPRAWFERSQCDKQNKLLSFIDRLISFDLWCSNYESWTPSTLFLCISHFQYNVLFVVQINLIIASLVGRQFDGFHSFQ
jgi:hypothetical protein